MYICTHYVYICIHTFGCLWLECRDVAVCAGVLPGFPCILRHLASVQRTQTHRHRDVFGASLVGVIAALLVFIDFDIGTVGICLFFLPLNDNICMYSMWVWVCGCMYVGRGGVQ